MLAIVVDIANKVVTARDTRAGAYIKSILDVQMFGTIADSINTELRSIQKENQETTTIMLHGR